MEAFVSDAGMENLFEGGSLTGFGRRLSSTDGMLEGFFNLLDDVEWTCESIDLPKPDALPQFYHAKIRVKHLHEAPILAYSHMFTDLDGNALELAGIVIEDGKVYKTWTEDLVKTGSVTAYMSQFEMAPFMQELRLKRGLMQMRMETVGSVGYRCLVDGVPPSAMQAAADNADGDQTMEFMGVEVDKGIVIRHWRMYTVGEDNENTTDDMMMNMVKAGMVPDVIDYFDVDTDPSGTFEPGQPYRIRMRSTVPGSKIWTEKQYLSITPLPVTFEMEGIMDMFGVSLLDTECKLAKEVVNETDAQELVDDASFLNITNRSATDPNFKMPPAVYPWTEMGKAVEYNFDRLIKTNKRDKENPGLVRAKKTRYWSEIIKNRFNKDAIESIRVAEDDDLEHIGNVSNGEKSGSKRRRLGTWTAGDEEGSYFVSIDSADRQHAGLIRAEHREHEGRRLADGRRLGATSWKFDVGVTFEKINIELEIGAATMKVVVNYCHQVTPTLTNWGACQTGRAGAGDIVKMEGYASGKQIIFPWPTVSMEMGGLLVYDNTAAMGVDTKQQVFLRSVGARGQHLQDNIGNVKMGPSTGLYEKFDLIDASGGIGQLGTDMRFWIKSHRNQYLQDNNNNVKWSASKGSWEKIRLLDAGGGRVYLQSYRGKYLATQETSKAGLLKCKVTIYRSANCRDGSKSFETTSSSGQEWKFDDDNWESAKAEGDCFQTEFYDEDEQESNYEDNQWEEGNFGCINFKSDLDDDMAGLKIWAKGPPEPPWEGNVIWSSTKIDAAKWQILQNTPEQSAAVSFGDPLLYGGLTFAKDVDIIFDFGASFTTELGAAGANHPQHGLYLAEIYGKGIVEFGIVSLYLLLKFNPNSPWDTKYKDWTMCASVGYEVDTWIYTYRDEFQIYCQDLWFR